MVSAFVQYICQLSSFCLSLAAIRDSLYVEPSYTMNGVAQTLNEKCWDLVKCKIEINVVGWTVELTERRR